MTTYRPADDPLALPWLCHLTGDAPYLAIGTRLPDGKKAYVPTAIRDADDRVSLIAAHLAGTLPPRVCQGKTGDFLVEKPLALGYFAATRRDNGPMAHALTLDIDGHGHVDGLSPAEVERQTWELAGICEEAELAPTVIRSNSGAGRHVIITLPEPIEAGMAAFIAQGVIGMVAGAEKTEYFPRTGTLREGQFGRLVALPLNGAAPGAGGGRIIDRQGLELTAAAVRIPAREAIAAFAGAYQRNKAAEESIRKARQAEGRMIAHLAHAADADATWTQATVEQVARAYAEVCDDRETEDDFIYIRCPTHGGSCFHVNVVEGFYCCHKCGHKSGGPAAPFTLLRLLRPAWTTNQIRTELGMLIQRTQTAAGAPT